MDIKRNRSQPTGKGPAEYFTGTVRIDRLFQADHPRLAAYSASPHRRGDTVQKLG